MPINSSLEKGPGGGGRTTFRPPWVKETNTPSTPWSKRTGAGATDTSNENGQPSGTEKKEVKLQSKEIKVPVTTVTTKKPALTKSVAAKGDEDKKPATRTVPIAIKKDDEVASGALAEKPGKFVRPLLKKVAKVEPSPVPPVSLEKTQLKETPKVVSTEPVKKAPTLASTKIVAKPVAKPVPDEDSTSSEEESEEEEEEETEEEEEETEEESEEEPAPKITTPSKAQNVKTPVAPAKSATPSIKPTSQPGNNTASSQPKPSILKPALKKTPDASDKSKTSSPSKTPEPQPPQACPPPPPPPPKSNNAPPPPPPPPGLIPPPDFEKKPITEKQKQAIEKLKVRPRKRPDWSDMMKEVETGIRLKHIKCNDRSSPILTTKSITNIKGQYIYETEKANVHNALLKQIQFGVRLKHTKTNDRSKPILEGLRKFRRQMTIEEQIQKSESRAQMSEPTEEESPDEMDDIDKLRDDLQSSKQMLALELRNKEAQERENKRLLAKIQNLEAELHREKSREKPTINGATNGEQSSSPISNHDHEVLVKSLKSEAEEAQKTSKLLEKKYHDIAEQLDTTKSEMEEQKRQIANLERKLAQQGYDGWDQQMDYSKRSKAHSKGDFDFSYWQTGGTPGDIKAHKDEQAKDSSPEPEIEQSDSEEDESEEKKAERAERRLVREVKMMQTKLNRLKDKQKHAKVERENLRESMKKNQAVLKTEHKKFKQLQREVDKMAAMMKEDDDDEDADGDNDEDAEEKTTKANTENNDAENKESEDEDSESDEESEEETENESESEPEDAGNESKKLNYDPRIKRYEGRVLALKKGNYLLQTNVDRIQDEINMMREKSVTLQADLDSVLSELG